MSQKLPPRIDERWIRHDWRMWIRPDIARWMKPGVDPADVIPALARERAQQEARRAREEAARAAEDAALAAEIEHERRAWAALKEEMKEVNAEMARRRRCLAEEAKYSPSQPRVPAGNPRGGQWTDRNGGQGTVANPSLDTGQRTAASLAQPMGNVGIGDVSGSSEVGDLFKIGPADDRVDGVQFAAGYNQVGPDGKPVVNPDGTPYYEPGGHHDMPESRFRKWNLDPETRRVFNQSTTGEVPGRLRTTPDGVPRGNFWDGPNGAHGHYNTAIDELSTRFFEENKITPEQMTPNHARELLKQIRESEDPRIRDFNNTIRMLQRIYRLRTGRGNQ